MGLLAAGAGGMSELKTRTKRARRFRRFRPVDHERRGERVPLLQLRADLDCGEVAERASQLRWRYAAGPLSTQGATVVRDTMMRRAAVALLCTGAAALVAPPAATARRSALSASATADVPVKTFDGGDAGTATLNLKVTKGEKDMYVVHRKYVGKATRASTASTKTRSEVRAAAASPSSKRARAGPARARSGLPSRSAVASP